MPKRSAKKTPKTNGNQKAKKCHKLSESDVNGNEETDNGVNGLRRSQRASTSQINASKSKYFDGSDEEVVANDEDIESDTEFKPKSRAKRKKTSLKPIVKKSESQEPEDNSSSDDGDDWEEVKDNAVAELDDYNPEIPSEGVDITISTGVADKKKKAFDVNNWIRQRINQFKRELQSNKHKILCYALNPVDIKAVDLILSENQRRSPTENKPKVIPNGDKVPKKSKSKKPKIVVISDSDDESVDTNERLDLWVEVYVESEKKWICLDLSHDLVDKPMETASKSVPHLSYVIALDSDGYIREVTQRYCDDWMSVAMKRRRTDPNWWTQTLTPFERKNKSSAEKSEDIEFEEKISATPLPTKVGDYKNHPLYVLKKDLLKFQGIYPSDAPPLGFFRGEPVYARECVHLLRSRETWLRFVRTVRAGESAYKLVKSRPKWDKYAKVLRKDLPLEVFGEWQTDPYVPPEAMDGKVPRNNFGNVDLYQPSMLPKGCVHIQLPGLLRIANKLNIDCAAAITGFDNNCGGLGAHPVMDGYIVCQEFKEVLIAAWDEEQEIARKREKEKKEKRVIENWKKLAKGLLIRESVKKKYSNCEDDSEGTDMETDN
ncbi:unnamed protein product [Oppiella nova]|uniref:Uncharacterized protein n=1 Tax=Oppiella nova TaxID=334625 RepID=A0A7R9QKC7_9ACAR|nr:unnamed protein product [Oppiella nova]CAG2167561.1 unnamed protein product [Oppiella nova]